MIDDKNDRSLCEKSMKMVVNIIKLSSFSIAKMSLGATKTLTPATQDSDMATDELLQRQAHFRGTQKSEKLQSSSKHCSLVMPGPAAAANNESHMVHKETKDDSDGIFGAYIKKVHEKNRSNLHESSKHCLYVLLPPPPAPFSRKK